MKTSDNFQEVESPEKLTSVEIGIIMGFYLRKPENSAAARALAQAGSPSEFWKTDEGKQVRTLYQMAGADGDFSFEALGIARVILEEPHGPLAVN
jgi:hypothetical protein